MTHLTVDPQRCSRDAICIETCPMGIIERESSEAVPRLIQGGAELCIACGHCVAVCPKGALSHSAAPVDACPPVQPDLLVTAAQAEQFLRMRRSIRRYKPKPVPRQMLAQLIDVARHAPSGHNSQPVEWLVLYDTDELRRLAGMVIDWMRHLVAEASPLAATLHLDRVIQSWEAGNERIFRGAPHVIAAHAPQAHRAAASSCTIALTYLELMTSASGLGGCWAGYFAAAAQVWPPLMEALALPDDNLVYGAMMVGYPKFRYHRMPPRKPPSVLWR